MSTKGRRDPHKTIPMWARPHDAVVSRIRVDMAFRLRVLSALPKERPGLIGEAEAWSPAKSTSATT